MSDGGLDLGVGLEGPRGDQVYLGAELVAVGRVDPVTAAAADCRGREVARDAADVVPKVGGAIEELVVELGGEADVGPGLDG